MRPASLQLFTLLFGTGILVAGCSDGEDGPLTLWSTGGAGGPLATGGAAASDAEGSGATPGSGGNGTVLPVTGGQDGVGGNGSGSTTGGVASGGGTTGGTGSSTCTNVRPTGTEWDEATCDMWATQTSECSAAWMSDNHYCDESCGRCSPGTTGTGGGVGTGGTTSIPSTCSTAEMTVCNNETGTHCGYTYEYWKDHGTGCMVNTADGFSVEWSNIGNLLARKSVRPGSANLLVTYEANYRPNGNSYLTVYGWTRNPLVEYYIVDSWGDWRPPGSTSLGTVQSDGGTYDIYRTERVNQPSIDGPATFSQYWSVRTQKRESGTITVGNHFSAWAGKGMNMGSFYEVSLTVEGYQSAGSADVKLSIQ